MNRTTALICASLCLFAGALLAADSQPGWKPIFNGKNLNGWTVHYASKTPDDAPPAASLFDVVNGEIHVYRDEAAGSAQPNAYIVTDADYKDYKLSLEYKWGEKKFAPRLEHVRDAGLLYHVHRAIPANWPASAEAQIQEGDTGDSWAVSAQVTSFVDPKTGRYTLPENGGVPHTVGKFGDFQRTRHGRVNEYPGWNTLEVIVRGDRATHIVNGVVNMRVSDIKSWDEAIEQLGEARPRQDRAAGRERGALLSQHQSASAHQGRRHAAGAEAHRGLVPGAVESDAGCDARRCALGRRHPVRRQERRRLEERQRRRPARWNVVNGEMVIAPGTGDIQTKESFGDVQLHVEWMRPALPADKVNQDRGNSGVFLQDIYEVQVLDNFENKTYVNGMVGSIYKQFPPLVNATFPAENVADLRHHLHRAALCSRRFAGLSRRASPCCTTACWCRTTSRSRAAPPTSARPTTSRMGTCRCACRITGTWCGTGTSGCASSEMVPIIRRS